MRRIPPWLLPTLLVLNSLASLAIATRTVELRRAAQVWDLRAGAWLARDAHYKGGPEHTRVEARRIHREAGQGRHTRGRNEEREPTP